MGEDEATAIADARERAPRLERTKGIETAKRNWRLVEILTSDLASRIPPADLIAGKPGRKAVIEMARATLRDLEDTCARLNEWLRDNG